MDKYRIRITKQAKEHLSLIKEYFSIEMNDPKAAKRTLALVKEQMSSLSVMPYRIKCIAEPPWGELEICLTILELGKYVFKIYIDIGVKKCYTLQATLYEKVNGA